MRNKTTILAVLAVLGWTVVLVLVGRPRPKAVWVQSDYSAENEGKRKWIEIGFDASGRVVWRVGDEVK